MYIKCYCDRYSFDSLFVDNNKIYNSSSNQSFSFLCLSEILVLYLITFFISQIFEHVDELFPLLLKTLSDPSDEVIYQYVYVPVIQIC